MPSVCVGPIVHVMFLCGVVRALQGDFYPGTTLGQLLFPVMVILILIVVPVRVSDRDTVTQT